MANDAMLRTLYLPVRLKRNLAVGLDARWLELERDMRTGYNPGKPDQRMADLISDARQAYALGLIAYLPGWAKPVKAQHCDDFCDCGCEPTDEWHSEPRCACRSLNCPCVKLEDKND
jgi:hypothetical protein